MLKIVPSFQGLSNSNKKEAVGMRLIVFNIGNYLFGLPIEIILKIIPCPQFHTPIKNGIGIVDWESQMIAVIDLHHKLKESFPHEEIVNVDLNFRFLILTKTNYEEICGFAIFEPPTLMDIPQKDIRSVPLSYRQVAGMGFINHMAIISTPDEEKNQQIFILGT